MERERRATPGVDRIETLLFRLGRIRKMIRQSPKRPRVATKGCDAARDLLKRALLPHFAEPFRTLAARKHKKQPRHKGAGEKARRPRLEALDVKGRGQLTRTLGLLLGPVFFGQARAIVPTTRLPTK